MSASDDIYCLVTVLMKFIFCRGIFITFLLCLRLLLMNLPPLVVFNSVDIFALLLCVRLPLINLLLLQLSVMPLFFANSYYLITSDIAFT